MTSFRRLNCSLTARLGAGILLLAGMGIWTPSAADAYVAVRHGAYGRSAVVVHRGVYRRPVAVAARRSVYRHGVYYGANGVAYRRVAVVGRDGAVYHRRVVVH